MIYPIPKTVPEAAKILDEAMPGWYQKIDTDTLNMADVNNCVLGQLYEDYKYGIDRLFQKVAETMPGDEENPFAYKTTKWLSEIKARKQFAYEQASCNYAPSPCIKISVTSITGVIAEYPDGFRERFNSELDIPVGVRYRLVSI